MKRLREFFTRLNSVKMKETDEGFKYTEHPSHEGVFYLPRYQDYSKREDYEKDGVFFAAPMTAKEVIEPDDYFEKEGYVCEEKMDGVRATLHIKDGCVRVFSRRVSTKTKWLGENTDALPHLRDLVCPPDLDGTVLDGELSIPGHGFKFVSSTMNCTWHEAIRRQIEEGWAVFNAFDIILSRGADLTDTDLLLRKDHLKSAVRQLSSPYIVLVESVQDAVTKTFSEEVIQDIKAFTKKGMTLYPALYNAFLDEFNGRVRLSKKAYYEFIAYSGGEGVIIKDLSGKYSLGKRTNAFLKVKKQLTRDVIVMGFSLPTKEYKGKLPDTWKYWEDVPTGKVRVIDWDKSLPINTKRYRKEIGNGTLVPVSKYYAEQWVGNVIFGVTITEDEIATLPPNKKFNIRTMVLNGERVKVVEVGECSGFDEEERLTFSCQYVNHDGEYVFCKTSKEYDHAEKNNFRGVVWVGTCIEVLCNDVFTDTGRLRHPRYHRTRPDKLPIECTWGSHVSISGS